MYYVVNPPSLSLVVPTISPEAIWLGVIHDDDDSVDACSSPHVVPASAPHAIWLGAKHDGYEISPIENYIQTRLQHIHFYREHAGALEPARRALAGDSGTSELAPADEIR